MSTVRCSARRADRSLRVPTGAPMTVMTDVPGRALAVYAHPDDPEVSCGGTLAHWAAGGAEVHLVVVNAGRQGVARPGHRPGGADRAAGGRGARPRPRCSVWRASSCWASPTARSTNDLALRGRLVGTGPRASGPTWWCAPTRPRSSSATATSTTATTARWAGPCVDAVAPAAASPLYFPEAGPPHQVGTLLLSGTFEPDAWVDVADARRGQGGGGGVPREPDGRRPRAGGRAAAGPHGRDRRPGRRRPRRELPPPALRLSRRALAGRRTARGLPAGRCWIVRHSPMARRASDGDHGHAAGADDRADRPASPASVPQSPVALEVDEGPADEAAAQPAHEDRHEGEHPGRRRGQRAGGVVVVGGLGHRAEQASGPSGSAGARSVATCHP